MQFINIKDHKTGDTIKALNFGGPKCYKVSNKYVWAPEGGTNLTINENSIILEPLGLVINNPNMWILASLTCDYTSPLVVNNLGTGEEKQAYIFNPFGTVYELECQQGTWVMASCGGYKIESSWSGQQANELYRLKGTDEIIHNTSFDDTGPMVFLASELDAHTDYVYIFDHWTEAYDNIMSLPYVYTVNGLTEEQGRLNFRFWSGSESISGDVGFSSHFAGCQGYLVGSYTAYWAQYWSWSSLILVSTEKVQDRVIPSRDSGVNKATQFYTDWLANGKDTYVSFNTLKEEYTTGYVYYRRSIAVYKINYNTPTAKDIIVRKLYYYRELFGSCIDSSSIEKIKDSLKKDFDKAINDFCTANNYHRFNK